MSACERPLGRLSRAVARGVQTPGSSSVGREVCRWLQMHLGDLIMGSVRSPRRKITMPQTTFSPPPFCRDPRGNRLLRWQTVNESGGHVLLLCGPGEVVDQVSSVAPEYVHLALSNEAKRAWTHALRVKGPLRTDVENLLQLLTAVVLLPSPPNIDTAIALDWYKLAQDTVDPWEWPNTEVAELVRQGKYLNRFDARRQADAGLKLVARLCDTIRCHAGLSRATVILDVPGHDSEQVSFGSRVACSVASRLNLPVAKTSTSSTFRPPAKNADSLARITAIKNKFFVRYDLRYHNALVVDDVFKSGTSMSETARAIRVAGAVHVNGIVAVRTMRAR